MRISAQEEFGLRCLLRAALGSEAHPISIQEIARHEGMALEYASKILSILKKAGFLNSVRGVKGGYFLSRAPEQITLAELMRALGGEIFEGSSCDHFSGNQGQCVHVEDGCGVKSVWMDVSKHFFDAMQNITLATLLEKESAMAARRPPQPYRLLPVLQ